MSPTRLDAVRHRQVLAFLCAQIPDIRFDRGQEGRLELSIQVARHALKKKHVAERVRVQESLWVRQHPIPESGQGRNARVKRLLEGQGTRSAMEQYISGAANSEGLAQAAADHWNSLEDSESPALADRELIPRAAREWFRRMGYRWVDLRKGVNKDGHEQPDAVAYRKDTLLPWPFRPHDSITDITHTQTRYLPTAIGRAWA